MHTVLRSALAAIAIAAATVLPPTQASAQSAGARIPVGPNPLAIAVNPVTNKVYVANADADTVTIINGNTGATSTLPVGDYPAWVGINVETNRIYVSNLTSANTSIIDGATDTVVATPLSGGGGWTAVNPITNSTYVLRYGAGDEVNVILGDHYELTSATWSYQPTGLALNPTNNWLYVVHQTTGDVVALDMTTPMPYPPLKCPDGSGGFRPQPPDTGPPPGPCINVPDTPVAVAVNPVTNRIYALSNVSSNQISVIDGTNSTFVSLTPAGSPGTAKAIAVNPVTNRIYAAFSSAVVVIDGASNGMTVLPAGSGAGGPAAIGINVLTNTIYVPGSDGTMLVIDGATNATSAVGITAGANGVAVNPLANMVYVLDSGGGVTPVSGAAGSAVSTGITTTITPLAGNTGGSSGNITLNAASSMTPSPLGTVRRVYFRIGASGPWSEASGTGPFTASYSGLAPGTYTLHAFATNGLEAPSINTDLANAPIVGNIASYTFSVSASPTFTLSVSTAGVGTVNSSPAGISCGSDCSESYASGTVVTLNATAATGYTFSGWSGECSGTGACQVTMDAAKSVTASFTADVSGELVTRYRLYHGGTMDHLYTTDFNEYSVLPACCGWQAEGAIYRLFRGPGSYHGVAAVPYYRLYNPVSYQHHWTTDLNEYNVLPSHGWVQEGIDGYILPSQATGTLALHRLYYHPFGLHLWTTDANEVSYLTTNAGWIYEGVAGYVIPLP